MVNPYEIGKVADVIDNALTMDKAQAEIRMNALRNRESKNDLEYWFKAFLKEIGSQDSKGNHTTNRVQKTIRPIT